jgi:LuxR family glucitol operon transcriptional activator
MSDSLERKRRKDLESSIQETLDLIKQYEEKRRLADDPKEQKDCERQIADLRQLLEEYRAELSELEEAAEPQIELWPSSIPAERYYPLPGREQDLNQLLKALRDPQGPPAVVVDGLGGIGKTAMAVELARRALRQRAFEGAVGDSAKQEMLTGGEIIQVNEATLDFDGLLNAIARQLERWEIPTMKTDEKRAAISRLLRQHRYLVLVDNLETAENANKLVAHLQGLLNGSRAIVTSRKKVRHGFVRALSLHGLETEDSVFFLQRDAEQREVEQIIEASREDLIQIHEVTGGAPLALKLVVGQAKFLDLEPVLSGLQQAGSEIYPFIFRQSWEQLSPAAQRALIYIGRTVVTSVGWEELANVGIAQNQMALKQAVDELVDYSLLDVSFPTGEPRYSVHQLTRRFVNSDLPELWEEQGLM